MSEIFAEQIKKLAAPFIKERGFSFQYFHEKGGDSSCVYICRFQKGKDFFDVRETSGKYELHLVVYAKGEYRFPKFKRKFTFKSLFKKRTIDDERAFLISELEKNGNRQAPNFSELKNKEKP